MKLQMENTMEIKTGKWKRSPYRLLRYGALVLGAILLMCVYKHIYTEYKDRDVQILASCVEAGRELKLDVFHIGNRDVKSCVWYAGSEERLREKKLCGYTPTAEDVEQFIRVEVTLRDGSVYEDSRYFSVLPVLSLNSGTAYEEVEKETDTAVEVSLEGPGYSPEELYQGTGTIHLRGNSTAELPKRPFKLHLDEKSGLLGMGEKRHWVLLANAIDSTLLRDQLAYGLSADLGAEYFMDSRQVTLIYNGEYYGVYQLCEQIRVGKNRIDIYNWRELAEQIAKGIAKDLNIAGQDAAAYREGFRNVLQQELERDMSWIDTGVFESAGLADWNAANGTDYPTRFTVTDYLDGEKIPEPTGGVLLELDSRNRHSTLTTAYHEPIGFADPENGETSETLRAEIKRQIQTLEYAFHSSDFCYHDSDSHYEVVDEGYCNYANQFAREGVSYKEREYQDSENDGKHYSELIDMDSLLTNFLLCEFTMNWDAMKNSVYLYKDLEGLWSLGPAWDYDWGWGNSMYTLNTWYTKEWCTTSAYYANEAYYQTVQWNRYLIRDPYFLMLLWEKYQAIRETVLEELIRDGGTIDQYAEKLRPAAKANDARWGGCMGTFEGQKFDEGITELKRFMKERLSWMDEQFASVESLRKSFGYYANSSLIWISEVDQTSERGKVRIVVETEVPEGTAVSLQVNGTNFYTASLEDGKAVFEVPNAALRSGGNVAQARLKGADGEWLVNPDGTTEGDYTNAISNYAYFVK